jgi:hypothetical protein
LSGAFAIAALALIAALASVVGPRVLPEAGVVARWTIAVLAGLGVWGLAAWAGNPQPTDADCGCGRLSRRLSSGIDRDVTKYRTDATGAIRGGLELWIGRAKSR